MNDQLVALLFFLEVETPCNCSPRGIFYFKNMALRVMALLLSMWTKTLVLTGTVAAVNVHCNNDEDCSLNGVCVNSSCLCDPGWTTLPFGPNNTLSPGCGYLDFLPSPISACGNACAFHGGDGGVDRKTTSWGGSVLVEDGKYWMFAAEMANHCGLGQWTTNSQVRIGIRRE